MFMVHHRAVHQATGWCTGCSVHGTVQWKMHWEVFIMCCSLVLHSSTVEAMFMVQCTVNKQTEDWGSHPPSAVRGGLCRVLGTTWQSFNLHKCESWSKKRRKIHKFFGAKSSWHSIHDSTFRGSSFKAVQRRYRVAPIWGQFNDPVPPSWRVS